jgi:hypothetical protein
MFRFCDSFDHYGTADIPHKWTQENSSAIAAGGRRASNCLALLISDSFVSKTFTPQTGWTVGFGLKWISGSGGGWNTAASFNGLLQVLCGMSVNSDGTVSLVSFHGVGATTATAILRSGDWDYYEVECSFSGNPISYTAILRQNGIVILTYSGTTGLDPTQTLFNMSASNVHVLQNTTGPGMYFDDFYVNDNTGSYNTSFMGVIDIGCIYPVTDVTTQWTPSAGSSGDGVNYQLVNENPPDGDSSYIFTNTVGYIDQFLMAPAAPLTGQVQGVQFNTYARKDAEGSRAVTPVLNGAVIVFKNTTDAYSPQLGVAQLGYSSLASSAGTSSSVAPALSPDFYLADDYTYHCVPMDTQPYGAPWTVASINSSAFGLQLTA